ncbi:MAG: 2-keto-4-pentenoate hydratase [Arcobacter sp.]|nr:MAG: 2-keto-4-pentenoate hydratase [Arcobacter sp.]
MKLASLKNNTRDGLLVLVNKTLTSYVEVKDIARTLQEALDSWEKVKPLLEKVYKQLNNNELIDAKVFKQEDCESPLPRAYAWLDGSAYVNHVELTRKARGASIPSSFYEDPLMYQGGSDTFLGPREDICLADEDYGIDFEAEVAVITNDVEMACTQEEASSHIILLMLINDVSLRNLIPDELAKGIGFIQSKSSCAFSPVCVTPDELGEAWSDNKVSLSIDVFYNEVLFGNPLCNVDMTFSFSKLVSHAAKTRHLSAGTIIGSGTVSNKLNGKEGKSIEEGGRGYSCIAEKRMVEKIQTGNIKSEFMKFNDSIKISMNDKDGKSIFGEIKQSVTQYKK